MKVVSNATPIISLAAIDQTELLKHLFGKIYIPTAVYNEIKSKQSFGYTDIDAEYFDVLSIRGETYLGFLLNDLDRGEAEAIVLAKEIAADILIIDERLGYTMAKSQEITTIGTLSVLLLAKEKGLIPAVKPLLESMIEKGRWYSQNVYESFLKQIGEL